MLRSDRRPALAKSVGVAAAFGAALAPGCSSSDSSPEPQTQEDAATGNDALSDVFQDGSPEDVAQQLEAMVDAGPDGSGGSGGMAPAYKGVTFT